MLESRGGMEPSEFDGANVPVDIWMDELTEDDERYKEGFRFQLRARNYMPRKGYVEENACDILSDNRKELEELIKSYFIPLYQTAFNKLHKIISGEANCLYYWKD
jgi:hypothetical protein